MQTLNVWRAQQPLSLMSLAKQNHPPIAFHSISTIAGPFTSLYNAITNLTTPPPDAPNYPTHIPLSPLQKGALGILASLTAFADPRRGDLVAVVGETTGVPALRAIRDRMLRSPEGRHLFQDRPRITDATVAPCWDLPGHTFGGAYAKFMGDRNFRADERPSVKFVDDPELAWVVARAREVHDFWHVLFACNTNIFGETALKAVEFMQTGLPMTAMAVVAGESKMKAGDRKVMNTVYLPWAVRAGAQAADLMTIYYEKHFEEDLEEVRRKWRIHRAPEGAPGGVGSNQNSKLSILPSG